MQNKGNSIKNFLFKKIGKTIGSYQLIKSNDKVLVGLSGGKDSLTLLKILAERRKMLPIDYQVEAIHINVTNLPYRVNQEYLEIFCEELGVNFHFKNIEVDFSLKANKKKCFLCSWNRRKELFIFAKEHGFNKIALGHNMDDALETLVINMVYHSNISSLPCRLSMFNSAFEIIRPLIHIQNIHTQEFSKKEKFLLPEIKCPYEDKTKRAKASKIIKDLESLHPKAKLNIFNAMSNIDKIYLPFNTK